jgi:hypothetical protein
MLTRPPFQSKSRSIKQTDLPKPRTRSGAENHKSFDQTRHLHFIRRRSTERQQHTRKRVTTQPLTVFTDGLIWHPSDTNRYHTLRQRYRHQTTSFVRVESSEFNPQINFDLLHTPFNMIYIFQDTPAMWGRSHGATHSLCSNYCLGACLDLLLQLHQNTIDQWLRMSTTHNEMLSNDQCTWCHKSNMLQAGRYLSRVHYYQA